MTIRVRSLSMAQARSVSAALSAALLEEQAGLLIFERGLADTDHGRVTELETTDSEATEMVLGSSP